MDALQFESSAYSSNQFLRLDTYPMTREFGVLDENYFHKMLDLEGKRAERSGRPFLLTILDIRDLCNGPNRLEALRSVGSILNVITRETDIKGWYEYNYSVGILFTELGDTNIHLAKESIDKKIRAQLLQVFGAEGAEKIEVSSLVIPKQINDKAKTGAMLDIRPIDADSTDQAEDDKRGVYNLFSAFLRQKWSLFAGDVLLLSVIYYLGTCVCLGFPFTDLSGQAGACALSLLFYPVALYIFDLYNCTEKLWINRSKFAAVPDASLCSLSGTGFSEQSYNWEKGLAAFQIASRTTLASLFVVSLSLGIVHFSIQQGQKTLAIQVLLAGIMLAGWRVLHGILSGMNMRKSSVLVVGAGESAREISQLLGSPFSPYEVKGFLDSGLNSKWKTRRSSCVLGSLDQLMEIARKTGTKTVILAIPRNRPYWATRKILEARLAGIDVIEMPTMYEQLTGRIPVEHIEDQWLLSSEGFHLISGKCVQKIKRVIDFIASSILLTLAAPVMALTALAIRFDSPGPIFYRQERVGKGGKIFSVIKFRSMVENAEAQGATWARNGDPRVTRVGHWIRQFRIDELPQIWNVFKGDMSLVGPRPERPEFVKELAVEIPYYDVRHAVTPGVTGWAQVKYPYGASLEDALRKLEFELYYIKNMSILFDLRILIKTIGVVLLGQGAR
jgi:sugar transferase (PEP-CTERM system associated)